MQGLIHTGIAALTVGFMAALSVPALASPLGDAARRQLAPPDAVVKVGNEAPLIRYSRTLSGGAHTHGAWNGGWQITHAVAILAGNRDAEAKMLEQIDFNLRGENVISANGGYPAQHERHMTGAYAILRQAPHFWNDKLTDEQRRKIDLVMKAALVASAYTTADATYAGGARATALDGNTNMNRGWNPNYREGMIGALVVGTVYFGGVDAVYEILDNYDHAEFVAQLDRAGLSNTHETFTWAADHPDAGAPSPSQIERNVRNYRYNGQKLKQPFDVYRELTLNTYSRNVNCGLNDGKGIDVDGVATGVIASGCADLPNRGRAGMLMEFDARDANGSRSAMSYCYDGFRTNLTNHLVVVASGNWRAGREASELVERLNVGITDLRYKLENGYRDYSKGRGSTGVFDINRDHWDWSFRTTLPLWEEVLKPLHAGAQARIGRRR